MSRKFNLIIFCSLMSCLSMASSTFTCATPEVDVNDSLKLKLQLGAVQVKI